MITVDHLGYCDECGNELRLWQLTGKKDRYICHCNECGRYNYRDELSEETRKRRVKKFFTEFGNKTIQIIITEDFLPGQVVTPYSGVKLR